ncbi:hypothetical protein CDL15_Pgr028131 [Punica granatum]|uniref:Uncharacterized protein n=1 Tax=Punica granatum TaxID=22663 RepID=A0A218WVR4_PUNGR|nr:hypothetical protein CDL15_Pgr028131 [Punica granatum]PKI78896.1 hypothetical protein CRG98_000757 [Punica granatum]
MYSERRLALTVQSGRGPCPVTGDRAPYLAWCPVTVPTDPRSRPVTGDREPEAGGRAARIGDRSRSPVTVPAAQCPATATSDPDQRSCPLIETGTAPRALCPVTVP